jgi:hypothetical protein
MNTALMENNSRAKTAAKLGNSIPSPKSWASGP